MTHYYWDYGSGGNDAFGIFYMLLMFALIIVGAFITLHYLRHDHTLRSEDDALELLKKRYAKGEIDKKEFEEKRKDLSK